MKRPIVKVLLAFVLGFLSAAITISGCSKAADRTFTLYQYQASDTYLGQFRIDLSQLPSDAIKKRTDTGKPGTPETRIELKQQYAIDVILQVAAPKP